ncbi:MAG: hypothetical protein IJP22_02295 [Clostridia bacterium]|nr:hypothetical protein [Clostridia bacterium]
MIKKYRKPQIRIKEQKLLEEIALVDVLSTLLGDIVDEDDTTNEEWVG